MKAVDEVYRLRQRLLDDLPASEPLFVLRARDLCAADTVRDWCRRAREAGAPDEKVREAEELAARMDAWPVRQIPGRPETRTRREDGD